MSDYMFIIIADYFKNFQNTSNSAQQLFTTQSQKHEAVNDNRKINFVQQVRFTVHN